jgi:hypothetical protein
MAKASWAMRNLAAAIFSGVIWTLLSTMAEAQSERRYTSLAGWLSFNYPAGWQVIDENRNR